MFKADGKVFNTAPRGLTLGKDCKAPVGEIRLAAMHRRGRLCARLQALAVVAKKRSSARRWAKGGLVISTTP